LFLAQFFFYFNGMYSAGVLLSCFLVVILDAVLDPHVFIRVLRHDLFFMAHAVCIL